MLKRRFIAGAICPQCGVEDLIYVLQTVEGQSRHCNQCDFSQNLGDLTSADTAEVVSDWQPINLRD